MKEQGPLEEDEQAYYEEKWTRFSPINRKPSLPKLKLPEGCKLGPTSVDELLSDGTMKFGKLDFGQVEAIELDGKEVVPNDFEMKRPVSPEEE